MKLFLANILLFLFFEYVASDVIVYSRSSGQIMEEFRDMPARFGPSFPPNGVRYFHVQGKPSNGCSKMDGPPVNPDNTTIVVRWAVIVARYNCSFEEKIRNAQNANFDAVIVHNVGSNELEQMSAKNDDDISIPSVFVGENTGTLLVMGFANYSQFAIIINDDLPFNINTHLIIPFSIVVGLCFITMIGFMIVKCLREQRRMRRYRLPSNLLKKIPTIKFTKGSNYDMCAICLDDYIDGEKLRVLPCSHAYHTKCIDPWLTKNRRVCPICKRKVFARGEQRPRRRRSSSDSMSESDTDDRTPLLRNPTTNSNVSNHGTFAETRTRDAALDSSSRSVDSGTDSVVDQPYQPPQRINPFDRLPAMTTSQNSDTESVRDDSNYHQRFLRYLRWNPFRTTSTTENDNDDDPESVLIQSDRTDRATHPINVAVQSTTSSNNVLNKNLSGSFKNDGDSESDDDFILNPNQNTMSKATSSSAPRLGIVAIPNTSFNPESSHSTNPSNNTQYM